MRRTPKRFISVATNGPVAPYSNMLMPTASEITDRDQPNSFSSGTTSTPGLARIPAATSIVVNATAATTQA